MKRFVTYLVAAAALAFYLGVGVSGLDFTGIDRTVLPGDDFFAYANGAWDKATAIPEDRSVYGVQAIVQDLTRDRIVELIQGSTRAGAGADERMVGDFYASFMDETAIQGKGLLPLRPKLDAIAAIRDKRSLAFALGGSLRADVDPLNATDFYTDHLFGLFVAQALDDPSRNVPYLLQGGLGMPDRDYYVSTTERMVKMRAAYERHVAAMLALAGTPQGTARKQAARIVALETRMAAAHATRVESNDVRRVISWTRGEFTKRAPGLDWTGFFQAASLEDQPRFLIWHPTAIVGLASLVGSEPLETWKEWLAFHAIEHASLWLPKAFDTERFAFGGTVLTGAPQEPERWKRGIDATNASLGWVVGKLYVQRYFPAEAKAKAQAMADDLVKAFGKRIDALDWMTPATKAKAREKLGTLKIGVGYPDKWPDYSSLEIIRGDGLGNAARAELFEYRRALEKLHVAPDPYEWWMTPQTVNAVNLPLQNALNFPAARLQPPYFDPGGDEAANYGAVGSVIGHEISHSFDDLGSQFDAQGKLLDWWAPEDLQHFRAAAERLVAQYDAYRPFPDLAVSGRQTLSENIADVAGLATAFDAYRLSAGATAPPREGFTGAQRFFISAAQARREKRREASKRNQIVADSHAPGEYRADTARNLDAWYDAFSVKPGQKLFLAPGDRVRVW
jgi:predicted metalloendopeptidase